MEKKKELPRNLDLKKAPFRGVLSEIAKEQGVTRNAVWDAIYVVGNPRIRQIFMEKIDKRIAITERFETNYAS